MVDLGIDTVVSELRVRDLLRRRRGGRSGSLAPIEERGDVLGGALLLSSGLAMGLMSFLGGGDGEESESESLRMTMEGSLRSERRADECC
jgi:hypothetical protein